MVTPKFFILGLVVAIAATTGGCASTTMPEGEMAERLQASQDRINSLERETSEQESKIVSLSDQLASARLPAVSAAPDTRIGNSLSGGSTPYNQMPGGELLPPATPGQCYARVFVPPTYESQTEEVLASGASETLKVIPARYAMEDQQVLVEAASQRIEVIPAQYEWAEEQVLVKAASSRLEQIEAKYETREEQVLVKPAHTVWKKGSGPIQKVDSATGEIMCLVEVPAEYRTVRTRVQTAPPTTRTVEIPAEYKTIKRQVVSKPATTRTVEIPAKYKTVKVRVVAEPAREQRTPIAAKYQTVSKRIQITPGSMAWREVLCETNTTTNVVRDMQRALGAAGHAPGPIDGIIGRETLAALKGYQQEKRLPTGGVTLATLKSLGVR